MFVSGEVEFVLHRGKESARDVGRPVIVDGCRKNVRHLLIEVALAHADVADTLEEFAEISASIALEPIVIQCEPLDRKLVEMTYRPLAKAHGDIASDSHAYRQDHVEVVVCEIALYTP